MKFLAGAAVALSVLSLLVLQGGAPADEPAPPDIPSLLESENPEDREQAAALLGKDGKTAALKQVLKLVKDPDWGVRMAAIRALGPHAFKPGREAIRSEALRGETRAIRTLAAEVLRDHDRDAVVRRLAKAMRKRKKKERLPYIAALGTLGSPPAVEALEGQMTTSDPDHRKAAARALGRLRDGEKGLIRGLRDKKDEVRYLAACALAYVDTDSARTALLDFIAKARKPYEAYMMRRVGRRATKTNREAFTAALQPYLAKTKNLDSFLQLGIAGRLSGCTEAALRIAERARDPLTRAFALRLAAFGERALDWETVEPSIVGKDRRLRVAAAEAYLARAGKELPARLKKLLQGKWADAVMVAVRRALKERTKEILPELRAIVAGETLVQKNWKARVAACVALGRIGEREAFPLLEPFVKAREWWLRGACFEALFHTYDKRAIPILIAAFNDSHPVCKLTARKNLRGMTGKHYPTRKLYENHWKKVGPTLELKRPSAVDADLKKHGYATRKKIQDVLKGTDIVAIKGRWDKVQLVLEELKVKHKAVRAQELKVFGVTPKQIVLVNCEGSVDSETAKYLQWFVSAGGYMATTDWALVNATTKTFPGVVKGYVRQSTGNDVVVVEPGEPGHPALAGVFKPEVELKWWLEIQAFPIAVDDPILSTVLVDSLEMLVRYGSSAMMVEFPAGLGKVLHSTSHFYLQKEGFAHESDERGRMVFAADHLGLPLPDIRDLYRKGVFRTMSDTTAISRSYSMFQVLVGFIEEKRKIDLAD